LKETIMIGVIAKLTIKSGGNAAFEAALKPIMAKVRAEPGNKFYALYRTTQDTGYLLFERHESKAALDAHRAGPQYAELRRMLVDHLASRPDWQDMQEVL
jgi:quinol monooxygenase YgiN